MNTPAQQTKAPIDGAALLDQVEAFHRRFNVFPTESAYVAVALWDAHAHLIDCFETTPASRSSPRNPDRESPGRWRSWNSSPPAP